jgi:hypothetical protein
MTERPLHGEALAWRRCKGKRAAQVAAAIGAPREIVLYLVEKSRNCAGEWRAGARRGED